MFRSPIAPSLRSRELRSPAAVVLAVALGVTAALTATVPALPALAGGPTAAPSADHGATTPGVLSTLADWLRDSLGLGDEAPRPHDPAAAPPADPDTPSVSGGAGPFIDPNGHRGLFGPSGKGSAPGDD